MNSRISGDAGTQNVSSSDGQTAVSWYAFIPDQDTVISAISGKDMSGNTVNYLTTLGISGKTLKQGSYYSVQTGSVITSITITSGAVVGCKSV